MITDQLANIDHQIFYEDLTFTHLKSLPLFLHALVVSHDTRVTR
jgi:predicted nucleic acid-binding OB-fold protein